LQIDVCLPPRSTVIDTRPPAKRVEEENASPILRYEVNDLRSLEPYSYLVGYRKRGIGAQAYFWVAGAVGTTLVSLMITKALAFL
jgi:hypothetical protein